jgi:3-hydroxyisobutyrate dehydrogenase
LGTGLLGEAIGLRLLQQGVPLGVWNRNPDRSQQLLDKGAQRIDQLQGASRGFGAVISVLRDGPSTASVLGQMGELGGTTVLTMGTMGIGESIALGQQLQQQGGQLLEVPVQGSRPEALAGTLILMAAGAEPLFQQQLPLLKHFSTQPKWVGPLGSGAAMKLALNQLIASLSHGFSLALHLIQSAEVPVEAFMAVLRDSALYAPTFDKKLSRMLANNYANPNFSTDLLHKDLALFLRDAKTAGLETSGLDGLATLLSQAQARQLADLDYSALHRLTAGLWE